MRLYGGPRNFLESSGDATKVLLFEPPPSKRNPSAGASIAAAIRRGGWQPSPTAWDFLALALTAVAADFYIDRGTSADGWTREIELAVAVSSPDRWLDISRLNTSLSFLTTDRWNISVAGGGARPPRPQRKKRLCSESVALLSGGLDSLIGALDLTELGIRSLLVSQTVRGDAATQRRFAREIGAGLEHLQLNHNTRIGCAGPEKSQRARSLLFIALAVVAATALPKHRAGERIPLYLNENGFIAINPPLTPARVGSLSTRTAHPAFLNEIQAVLDSADLRVDIVSPYLLKTKGQMLDECLNQVMLTRLAAISTSCGRFQRYNYRHCGRCIPCQIRRGAFIAWGATDSTDYVFEDLGRQDDDHGRFDDVRAVALALKLVERDGGIQRLVGPSLSGVPHPRPAVMAMLATGFEELRDLHRRYGVA